MTKFKQCFLLGLIIFSLSTTVVFASEWQQQIKHDAYSISTRHIEGSDYLQVKAEVKINAPVSSISPYFSASDRCWQWQLRCDSTKLLKSGSANKNTVYVVVDMPWPIDDRDFVFDSTYSENPADKSIILTISPSEIEKKSDYVRAKSNVKYTLYPLTVNKTLLSVLMHTEFGGSTPAAFVNSRLHEELKNDLEALIELVSDEKSSK